MFNARVELLMGLRDCWSGRKYFNGFDVRNKDRSVGSRESMCVDAR